MKRSTASKGRTPTPYSPVLKVFGSLALGPINLVLPPPALGKCGRGRSAPRSLTADPSVADGINRRVIVSRGGTRTKRALTRLSDNLQIRHCYDCCVIEM